MIYCKTLDEPASGQDGYYALIERQWSANLNENMLQNSFQKDQVKHKLKRDNWYPDAAPSTALCQWLEHAQTDFLSDPQHQEKEFRQRYGQRYRQELTAHPEYWMALLDQARHANLTLVYACEADIASNPLLNHAKMLAEFLDDELDRLNDASSPVCYAHLSTLD